MVLYYMLSLFKNREDFLHGDNKEAYISFDDMCHLRRLIESKQTLHPSLGVFLQQVRLVWNVEALNVAGNHAGCMLGCSAGCRLSSASSAGLHST